MKSPLFLSFTFAVVCLISLTANAQNASNPPLTNSAVITKAAGSAGLETAVAKESFVKVPYDPAKAAMIAPAKNPTVSKDKDAWVKDMPPEMQVLLKSQTKPGQTTSKAKKEQTSARTKQGSTVATSTRTGRAANKSKKAKSLF